MSLFLLLSGIVGSLLAMVGSIWFFKIILSEPKISGGDLFYMFILVIATLTGFLALLAIAVQKRKPGQAPTILWFSIIGMFIAAIMGDVFTLGVFLIPAALLLIPKAVSMSRETKTRK